MKQEVLKLRSHSFLLVCSNKKLDQQGLSVCLSAEKWGLLQPGAFSFPGSKSLVTCVCVCVSVSLSVSLSVFLSGCARGVAAITMTSCNLLLTALQKK